MFLETSNIITKGESSVNLTTDEDIKQWMKENLVDKNRGALITGQSASAFRQSVQTKKIEPFFEIDGETSSKIRLYKIAELEKYAKTKRK